MNITKMSVATVLALVHLMLAIPLAFFTFTFICRIWVAYQVLIK